MARAPEHDAYSQTNVVAHADSSLDKDLEYQHEDLHHHTSGKKQGEDQIVHTQDATKESLNLPVKGTSLYHGDGATMSEKPKTVLDPEAGSLTEVQLEDDAQTSKLSSRYSRYRLYIHLVIWLFFTG